MVKYYERLALWIKSSADDILKYVCLIFLRKQVLIFHVNCLQETICIKCRNLYSRKTYENISKLSSAEFFTQSTKRERIRLTFHKIVLLYVRANNLEIDPIMSLCLI